MQCFSWKWWSLCLLSKGCLSALSILHICPVHREHSHPGHLLLDWLYLTPHGSVFFTNSRADMFGLCLWISVLSSYTNYVQMNKCYFGLFRIEKYWTLFFGKFYMKKWIGLPDSSPGRLWGTEASQSPKRVHEEVVLFNSFPTSPRNPQIVTWLERYAHFCMNTCLSGVTALTKVLVVHGTINLKIEIRKILNIFSVDTKKNWCKV